MGATLRLGQAVLAVFVLAAGSMLAGERTDPVRLTHAPIEPLAQAVELRLDPAREDFSGRTVIDLVASAPVRLIRLHAQDLELQRVVLEPRAGGAAVSLNVARGEIGLLTLTCDSDLSPGAYRLVLDFTGVYRRDGVGLYKTEFEGEPYLFTQLESRYARLAFPCWDEPDFKYPWQVTLMVPEAISAYSNSEVAVRTATNGWKTLAFARTPPMPSYLVAVAVGPFEEVPVAGMSFPGRIITAKGQAGLAADIARETPKILTTLEDYFGIPYPYGKLDQVAVPEFTFGGMENAGLITYRDTTILRAPGTTGEAERRGLVQIVAHEAAHHWFGDLVTMAWWNDLWLNESFASWMEGKVLNTSYPELRYDLNAVGGKQRAMKIDALPSTGAVRRDLTASDDPEKFVDDLSYEKGEAVLTMIESWIGADAFRTAMKHYFHQHRWGSTRAEDLWAAFDEVSGADIAKLASSFIEQPGVPQVTLEVLSGDRVRIRQQRYAALGGSLPDGAARTLWRVPMRVKYAAGGTTRTERILLSERESTHVLPGISSASWIMPNAGETGYYRWRIAGKNDSATYTGLAHLDAIERLGVLLNASAVFDSGDLEPAAYITLLTRLADDPVPDVARRAVEALMRVRRSFLEDGDDPAFAAFCRATLRGKLDRIGMSPAPGEAPEIAALRRELIQALGIRGMDPDVIAMARETTTRLLGDVRSVDAGLAETVLEVAAWHGDAALFDACEERFRSSRVPSDRSMFLGVLGSFRDPALCDRALALSLGAGVRSHERLVPAWTIAASSAEGRRKVVLWMEGNFDAIKSATSEHAVSYLIALAEGPDAALFARARNFLTAPQRISDAASKVIAEATDRNAQLQALRQRWADSFRSYIRGHTGSP